MGKVIVKKMRGMNICAKVSLTLLIAFVFSVFMYQGWYKPLNAEAAIARVQAVTLNNNSNTSGTITIAPTHAGNLLVVVIGGIQASTSAVSNVRLGSTSLTKAKDSLVSGGPQYVSIWYLANIPSGQTTVTYTSTAVDNGAVVAEYSGVATTSPLDVTASAVSSNGSTSTLSTGTATSTAANELWIGAFGDNTSTAFSSVTGTGASMYAQIAAFGTQLGLADSYSNSAGSATMGCTGSSDWWSGAIAVFKPAAVTNTTTLGNGVAGANASVCPGTTGQKLDGFSFVTSSGTDSVTALTVTTTNYAAIANISIWNEAGTTQYFSTVSSPTSNTINFSGGTAIPVTTTAANFKVLVDYKPHGTAPSGNTTTTAYVSAYTATNTKAGTDSADTTLTLDNSPATAASWGTNSGGVGQVTLNWTLGTTGDSVMIARYPANSDTTLPTDGTVYTVSSAYGTGGTVVYVGTGTTYTDTVAAGTY